MVALVPHGRASHPMQTGTVDKGKILLMLYERAIELMKESLLHLKDGDMEWKGNCLLKAQDIVLELKEALDFRAGDITWNLLRLYLYVYRRLCEGNIHNDPEAIKEAIKIMSQLHSAWKVAVQERDIATCEVPARRFAIG